MRAVAEMGRHFGVLLLAGGVALWSAWRAPAVRLEANGNVELWSGQVDEVRDLHWASKGSLSLMAADDAFGRYYVVTDVPDPNAATVAPLGPARPQVTEQGAPPTSRRFISVSAGRQLLGTLVPLWALRNLGVVSDHTGREFGLAPPVGTLSLRIGGARRTLEIGSSTGALEVYGRLDQDRQTYVIPAGFIETLRDAPNRLSEKELHGFDDGEITRLKLTYAGKDQEFERVDGKREAWSTLADPHRMHVAASNWLQALARLRLHAGADTAPEQLSQEPILFRIEYFGARALRGFVEVVRVGQGRDERFLARSEWTRWYGVIDHRLATELVEKLPEVLR